MEIAREISKQVNFIARFIMLFLFGLLIFTPIVVQSDEPTAVDNQQNTEKEKLYKRAIELIDSYRGRTEKIYEAIGCLNKVLKIDPNYALAYVGMARATRCLGYINNENFEPGTLEQCQLYLDKAMQIDPNLPQAYITSYYNYKYRKDLLTAKKMFKEAERLAPDAPDVVLISARFAAQEKRTDEAINLAKKTVEISNNERIINSAYRLIRDIYIENKQYSLAEEVYLKIIELEPDSAWAKSNYSSFLIRFRKDYDKAIEYVKLALEQMDFGMGHRILSKACYQKGYDLCWNKKEYKSAIEYFELAVENDPWLSNAYYGLGVSYYNLFWQTKDKNYYSKSKENLNRALQIDPNNQQAEQYLKEIGG